MKPFRILLLIVALCACNDTTLVASHVQSIKTVRFLVDRYNDMDRLVCVGADATYPRDVNDDGILEDACYWSCAWSPEYETFGDFEVYYFVNQDMVGESYYGNTCNL